MAAGGEKAWILQPKQVMLFVLVGLTAFTLPFFRKLNDLWPNTQPALVAILAGMAITALTYLPCKYIDPKLGFSSAVLLGLLTAEFCVYGSPKGFPLPITISFMLFMFYMGLADAEDLWPEKS